VVTDCDHLKVGAMQRSLTPVDNIERRILIIRGQTVITDRLVYELYGLTEEEIKMIEEGESKR